MATMPTRSLPTRLQELPGLLEKDPGCNLVLEALGRGRAATVDGAWNSSASLVAALLAQKTPRSLLLVLAHPRDVDFWIEDIYSFTGLRSAVFPAWESLPSKETVLDDIGGQRLRVVRQLESDSPHRLIVTTFQALLQPVPSREQLQRQRRRLKVGDTLDLENLSAWLVESGYQRMEAVELPGEFSRRGGIFDVFSPDAEAPYRLELFGDDVESIRQFAQDTQRSLGDLKAIELTSAQLHQISKESFPTGHLCDYLPPGSWTVLVEPSDLQEQGKHYLERVSDIVGLYTIPGVMKQLLSFPSVYLSALPQPTTEATWHLHVESVERFSGEVTKLRDELDHAAAQDRVLIACHNEAEQQRLGEIFKESKLLAEHRLGLAIGQVRAGFRIVFGESARRDAEATDLSSPEKPAKRKSARTARAASAASGSADSLVVLGDHELFHRDQVRSVLPRRQLEARAIDSFLELQENDLVVHLAHGIARFRGMQVLERSGQTEEHLILEFSGGTRIFVPASKIDLVQKYVGGARTEPELSKFGGASWQKRKDKVSEAVLDLASEMIELQALREAQPGVAFPPDSDWQREFEAAFPYQETPDQLTSLGEIKADMQRARPMDRLICGDVGYGKTELAIRAAFKTIDNGRQVALLVPTTVLAEQHYRTFTQRFAEYPFSVETISRWRSAAEQKRILSRLSKGGVDIIIGTHRLVSADVQFKDLGLVIIDEEQRFGVEHKERLKKLRQTVDVLTLTATPIPRTLHLSLLGIRDISNLETPPPGRLAIETRIIRWDKQLLRHAIIRELNREGQIYFVHNRVQNIHEIAQQVQSLVPEANIVVGHGQMAEGELEKAMVKFVNREADILVATTIIESGLDIPNANTIFINQADNYGLADLHQLRGRVGRYKHRAYAYLVLDDNPITPNASKRLKAIEEFTELGAGFKIAMRDLEIRGAGNILGNQQSGHIAAVGYELYCQLLENAVRSLKQMPLRTPLEVTIDLPWNAYLPRDYVAGQKQKIEVYRRLSRVRKLDRLEDFRGELRDRFGPIPEPVEWLLRLAELRLYCERWQIATIHLEGKGIQETVGSDGIKRISFNFDAGPVDLVLGYRNLKKAEKLAGRSKGRLRVVDALTAYHRLKPHEIDPLPLYEVLKEILRLEEAKV